jgi:hypothetical protein
MTAAAVLERLDAVRARLAELGATVAVLPPGLHPGELLAFTIGEEQRADQLARLAKERR